MYLCINSHLLAITLFVICLLFSSPPLLKSFTKIQKNICLPFCYLFIVLPCAFFFLAFLLAKNLLIWTLIHLLIFLKDPTKLIASEFSSLYYLYEVLLEIRESENCDEVLKEEIYEVIHDTSLNEEHDCNGVIINSINAIVLIICKTLTLGMLILLCPLLTSTIMIRVILLMIFKLYLSLMMNMILIIVFAIILKVGLEEYQL